MYFIKNVKFKELKGYSLYIACTVFNVFCNLRLTQTAFSGEVTLFVEFSLEYGVNN